MSRLKKKVISNVTLEQAQEASELFAVKQTELSAIEAEVNEEINRVKSKYQEKITTLKEELKEPFETLEVYANEQQDNWGKKKSYELLHSVIGFRTGTPKVDKKKGFTWEAVVELLKKNRVFKPFIRTVEEVNKEAILAEKNESLIGKLKEDCFITIVQEETFYVTAKAEQLVS